MDLLDKMSKSLAQNKTMVKLTIEEDYKLIQVQDVTLFIHHLLLGLSANITLTDLTLRLPPNCWDWLQGELNILHYFEGCCSVIGIYIPWLRHICMSLCPHCM